MIDPYRLLQHTHGALGVLAAALLIHPAILAFRGRKRAARSLFYAMIGLALAFSSGLVLYPQYRIRVKPDLFRISSFMGYMFERKEHLAFAAVCMFVTGFALYGLAARGASGVSHKWAGTLLAVAAGATVLTAILGIVIASTRDFP